MTNYTIEDITPNGSVAYNRIVPFLKCGKPMILISLEDPRQPDIAPLLQESDDYSASLYPPEARYPVDAGFLSTSKVRFLVARSNGRAVGCGALVLGDDQTGEIKRLIVSHAARGQGVGRHLLHAIETEAKRERLHTIRLETGPKNLAAIALYQREGFRPRGPFGAYTNGPHSLFMEKQLTPPVPATVTLSEDINA